MANKDLPLPAFPKRSHRWVSCCDRVAGERIHGKGSVNVLRCGDGVQQWSRICGIARLGLSTRQHTHHRYSFGDNPPDVQIALGGGGPALLVFVLEKIISVYQLQLRIMQPTEEAQTSRGGNAGRTVAGALSEFAVILKRPEEFLGFADPLFVRWDC